MIQPNIGNTIAAAMPKSNVTRSAREGGCRAGRTSVAGAMDGGSDCRIGHSVPGLCIEHVAHAAYGMDELGLEAVVDLRPQAADSDVDDIGVAVEIHVPHL